MQRSEIEQNIMEPENSLRNESEALDSLNEATLAEKVEIKGMPDDFPEGGLRAWAVAIASSFVVFCTLGYSNSFGYVSCL
jgi:hypothetical protein